MFTFLSFGKTRPNLRRLFRKSTPLQLLVIGYGLIVLIIAILLSLPISSSNGTSQPFIDALFIATSGISTSGLTVVDIGSFYSLFGQVILLIDFQIGGLGYMTFFAFIAYVLDRKLSLTSAIVAVESLAGPTLGDLKKFFRIVVLYTFVFEFIGAAILALYWMREFSILKAIYLGIFHSVSTFCTAGFALFPNSLMSYEGDIMINLLIDILSLAGGISFFVLNDLYIFSKKTIKRLMDQCSLLIINPLLRQSAF